MIKNKQLKLPYLINILNLSKMSLYLSFLGSCGGQVPALCVLPVDNLPNLPHIVHANILIVDIVGMLPDVNSCIEDGILRRGVRPMGASISWLASSTTLRLLAALS